MVVVKEEIRRGPWTEQEDMQLVCYVSLIGERRWDLIAQVSGLNRMGKSCRLRWVNYLHPGLKRGRLTRQEQRLVLELHSKWGNRWSRIARRLPGRTDNEIKNYWRTHMRKEAQEQKRNSSPSSSSSSSFLAEPPLEIAVEKYNEQSVRTGSEGDDGGVEAYPMDQIWNEIATSEAVSGLSSEEYKDEACYIPSPAAPSPMWEAYSSDSLWKKDDEEYSMLTPMNDLLVSKYS